HLQTPPPPPLYTLSLHDALPIYDLPRSPRLRPSLVGAPGLYYRARARRLSPIGLPPAPDMPATFAFCFFPSPFAEALHEHRTAGDRKSTRLNSSHQIISYAVFCL